MTTLRTPETSLPPSIQTQIHRLLEKIDQAYKAQYGDDPDQLDAQGLAIRNAGSTANKLARRQKLVDLLTENPGLHVRDLMGTLGVSDSLVYTVRKELGIDAPARKERKNVEKRYKALLAEKGQISDRDAAQELKCASGTIWSIRQKWIRSAGGA